MLQVLSTQIILANFVPREQHSCLTLERLSKLPKDANFVGTTSEAISFFPFFF